MPIVTATELHEIGCRIFEAAETPRRQASDLMDVLVESNLVGHDSHGVQHIPSYVEGIQRGSILPSAVPALRSERGATATVDGQWDFGHLSAQFATDVAVRLAKRHGVAAVGLVHCNHTGRVGRYAEQAAAAGCVSAFLVGRTAPAGPVTPFGGAARALTPNPIAFGVPAGKRPAMIIDFATSVVAEGKVKTARARGEAIPRGWIVDKDGDPTTNPEDLDEGGMLLPFGGHKGYALMLLAAVLGGVVSGAETAEEMGEDVDRVWGHGGMLVISIDPSYLSEAETSGRLVDQFFERITRTAPAPGFAEVLIPGEPERRERERRRSTGIPVPEKTWDEIGARARALGIELATVPGRSQG